MAWPCMRGQGRKTWGPFLRTLICGAGPGPGTCGYHRQEAGHWRTVEYKVALAYLCPRASRPPRAPECAAHESQVLDPLRTPAAGPGLCAGRDAQGPRGHVGFAAALRWSALRFCQPRDIYRLSGSTARAPLLLALRGGLGQITDRPCSETLGPPSAPSALRLEGRSVERTRSRSLGGHRTSSGPPAPALPALFPATGGSAVTPAAVGVHLAPVR